MPLPSRLLCLVAVLPLVACSPSVKTRRAVLDSALSTQPARQKSFEATLQVLDEHPEYVDELFQQLLEHPPALNRFLAVSVSGLKDPAFAALLARHLTRQPRSLTEVMVQVLEAGRDKPEAQQAMARSLEKQPELTAATITSRPSAVSATTGPLLDALQAHPESLKAFLTVLRERKELVTQQLLSDPGTLTALMGELAKHGVKDATVAAQLRELLHSVEAQGGGGQGGGTPAPPAQPPPAPGK
jgi:hypothetical protein